MCWLPLSEENHHDDRGVGGDVNLRKKGQSKNKIKL